MLGAFHASPGLERAGGFPPLRALWAGWRAGGRPLAALGRATGMPASGELPILAPQVLCFRLQMAILTHPSFPLPIWRALQTRNHLRQPRPLGAGTVLDVETRVGAQRILERGAEVDLRTEARQRGEVVWEGLTTFYYRGSHGPPGAPSPLAPAPRVDGALAARWRTPQGGGLGFGLLTGDFNPLHWWDRYARRRGVRRASHHPPLLLGQCLARIGWPGAEWPRRLDAWIRGPVARGSDVSLYAAEDAAGRGLALLAEGEERPAILALLRQGSAAGPLP